LALEGNLRILNVGTTDLLIFRLVVY